MTESSVETRSFRFEDFELRATSDGRTLSGIAVPFDKETNVGKYTEVFRRGAFAKTISERAQNVKLLAMHEQRSMPLGAAIKLEETSEGLLGEFRVSKTKAGDEVLELVNDGVLDSFSVGFVPLRNRWNTTKDYVERQEVKLYEVSLVAFPAYEDAKILAVRDEFQKPLTPKLLQARKRLITI